MQGALRVALARRLAADGADISAVRVLAGARGREANRIRLGARPGGLPGGVYALAVLADGVGIVVPLRVELGLAATHDSEVDQAILRAQRHAQRLLESASLPRLSLDVPRWLSVGGRSLDLPLALAMLAHLVEPRRLPEVPVLATGALSDTGEVLPVDGMAAKLEAARAELGAQPAHLVVPGGDDGEADAARMEGRSGKVRSVTTFRAAASAVFGPETLEVRHDLLSFDGFLALVANERDLRRRLASLQSYDLGMLAAADRVRFHLELCACLRHLGRTEAAAEQLRLSVQHQRGAGALLAREAAERVEIHEWMTRLGAFELEPVVEQARRRLRVPFVSAHNELRCRGTLAQALAMGGHHDEAVSEREQNLPLHDGDDWLRSVLPGTLCCLAQDSAMAGHREAFDRWAQRLVSASRPGDAHQWRYSATVLLRGLVASGRAGEALAWAEGSREPFGVRAPRWLTDWVLRHAGASLPSTHPEVSAARHVVRALRHGGAPEKAAHLAATVPPSQEPTLADWVRELVQVERALALRTLGDPAADTTLASTRGRLEMTHAAAARFHRSLLDAPWAGLERALDTVWY